MQKTLLLNHDFSDFIRNAGRLNWILSFSGGADSVLALFALRTLAKRVAQNGKKPRLVLYYLDHGENFGLLEKSRRKRIFQNHINELRQDPHLNLELRFFESNLSEITSRAKATFEFTAAKKRRRHLHNLAREFAPAMVVTGHQLSDWYETLIMRVQRGAGLYSLAPFDAWEEEPLFCFTPFDMYRPPVEPTSEAGRNLPLGGWFRPLANLSREEIRERCLEFNLSWWDDPGNHHAPQRQTGNKTQNNETDRNNRRAEVRLVNPLHNPSGLRVSAKHFREAKNDLLEITNSLIRKSQNFIQTIEPFREYRIDLETHRNLARNERVILDTFLLKLVGLSPLSGKLREATQKIPFFSGPFAIEKETWKERAYHVVRRGKGSLPISSSGNRGENPKNNSGVNGAGAQSVRASEITKKYFIKLSYGKKSVKKILGEKGLSQRQRRSLHLPLVSPGNKYEVAMIPLSVFGMADILSEELNPSGSGKPAASLPDILRNLARKAPEGSTGSR